MRAYTEPTGQQGVVLMYHRVADLDSDPFSLATSPQHFEEHLQVLRRQYEPTRLPGLVEGARLAQRLENRVAVTFDDAYADVAEQAFDLLMGYEVPATVFVVSGYIGSSREFMWDELEQVLLQPGELPRYLQLSLEDGVLEWDLGEWAHYSRPDYRRFQNWRFETDQDPTARHSLFRRLYYPLKHWPEPVRRAVLDSLWGWAGGQPSRRCTHRTMAGDDIVRLFRSGLVDVGAHTVTHPSLAALPAEAQRDEVAGSRTTLQKLLHGPVTSFAYPYGGPTDFDAETVSAVREAGYLHACTTFDGLVSEDTDPFQLPRLDVRDWDGGEFAARLRQQHA